MMTASTSGLMPPGELHGLAPTLSGHLGRPMLKRARRRQRAAAR